MGVVVRRYIDILILLIPTPLALYSSFFAAASLLLCSFYNVFSILFMLFLYNIANNAQRTFKIVQKLRSRGHGNIIISTITCAGRLQVPRLPRARY